MASQRSPEPPSKVATAELRARLAQVVPELAALAARGLPGAVSPTSGASYAVTGVGGSAGPARLLVATLRSLGLRARFVPLSAFVHGGVVARAAGAAGQTGEAGETLCVFSQGLSPNARLALASASSFASASLFTSEPASSPLLEGFVARGGRVLTLAPAEESGTLLRVVGPPVAMLAAVLFAHEVAGAPLPAAALAALPSELEAAAAGARAAIAALPRFALAAGTRVAFVTSGEAGERGLDCGLGLKWVEGLGVDEPPTWDVLEIAHGPFHAFYTETRLLVTLGDSALYDRLEAMLVPERHALLRLPTRADAPLARLALEPAVNELLIAAFERAPRDLAEWPSKGLDAPLYAIGAALRR